MAAEARRGQFSAWISKKKSGSSLVRMRQYNKRYFTLDFDARTFYYTHAEGSAKASHLVSFDELADVQTLSTQAEQASDDASVCSKQSKMSLLKRMSSFSSKDKEEQEQHMVTVLIKPDKRMELLCSSVGEAAEWVSAIKEAIAMGGGPETGSGMVGSASSQASETNSPQGGSGYPAPAPSKPPLAPGSGGAMGGDSSMQTSQISDGQNAPEGAGAAIAAALEAPEKRNFLNFEAIEEEVRPGEESARNAKKVGENVTEVSATGVATMQAEDFGFGADEDHASSSSSSSHGSPRSTGGGKAAAVAVVAASPVDAAGSPSVGAASPAAPSPGGEARSSYKDRFEGKTMQERLANLEFSDDEEEDDDPFGLKQAKAGTG